MRLTPSPCGICNLPFDNSKKAIFCPDCGEPYHNDSKPFNCWQKIGKKCRVRRCQGSESALWAIIEKPFLKLFKVSQTKLKAKCPHCGSSMSPLQKYCMSCGYEINNSEIQETFFAYTFSKWVKYNHKVIVFILSVFIFFFIRLGAVSASNVIENNIRQQQTAIAYSNSQSTIIAHQQSMSETAFAYQNPTFTPTRFPSHTPVPQKTDKKINTPKPTPTRIAFKPYLAINECAKARVIIGDIVTVEDGIPNLFIRNSSDNHPSNNIIGHFTTGQKAKIISGPECSWGWIMWKIRRLSDNLEGWVAESDGDEFWLKLDD